MGSNDKKIKVIPLYLPQFHTIPENDQWWGRGFTEWVNVKDARRLFDGHRQPRVPLGRNYYDLSDVETLRWQCKIARDHGIYGFCMYHYWFNGHLLLQKPMEMLLANPDIDINYCISWANHDWTDGWKASDRAPRILISHDFNDEVDWVAHFNYMLPFFKDPRYMREDGKPLMVIYIPNLISKLNRMLDLWTKMAREAGLPGLTYIYQSAASSFDGTWDRSRFAYGVEMNPGYCTSMFSTRRNNTFFPKLMKYTRALKHTLGIRRSLMPSRKPAAVGRGDYDTMWARILRLDGTSKSTPHLKMIPCAVTDWDNTPRHGIRGWCLDGVSPEKFAVYFKQMVERTKTVYHTDMIFVFAWNEWAEGGYLEPDAENGYKMLEAIRRALQS